MFFEDYILRLIRMATAVLAKILGLKTAGEYEQARAMVDQLLELVVGLRADLVRRLDDSSLMQALTHQERLDTDRLWILAELFKQDGDIYTLQGERAESRASYLRALNFFLEVVLAEGAPNFPEPHDNIRFLVQVLEADKLPPETLYTLFNYYEDTGRFAQGESMLARLLAATGLQADIQDEYRAYYRRLLEKSDAELESGGLTRSHIITRLAELE